MIRTLAEYYTALHHLAAAERRLREEQAALAESGFREEEVARATAPVRAFLGRIRDETEDYQVRRAAGSRRPDPDPPVTFPG